MDDFINEFNQNDTINMVEVAKAITEINMLSERVNWPKEDVLQLIQVMELKRRNDLAVINAKSRSTIMDKIATLIDNYYGDLKKSLLENSEKTREIIAAALQGLIQK